MQIPPGSSPRSPTLEDLAALNREIAALVRAGVPLEAGLRQIAQDDASGAGKLAARLERETSAGKSLAEAIAAQGDTLPPIYRAIVETGLKAGRLPAALEGFAESAARTADLRRVTAQAAVYPAIVIVLAWFMLLTVAGLAMPHFREFDIDNRIWAMQFAFSTRVGWMLVLGLVAAVMVVGGVWWRQSGSARAASADAGLASWIPGARRAAQLCGQATFADLLGLMLAQGVPLVEALPLAAQASGGAALRRTADELASHLAAGQSLDANLAIARGLPPLVRVALLGSTSQEGLATGLARAGEVYRERAATWISNLAVIIPVTATLAVGALVVGAYAFLLLQPYVALLEEAASWY
jgi:type II secretory pathway component PulF